MQCNSVYCIQPRWNVCSVQWPVFIEDCAVFRIHWGVCRVVFGARCSFLRGVVVYTYSLITGRSGALRFGFSQTIAQNTLKQIFHSQYSRCWSQCAFFSVNAASKIVVPQASINVSNVAQEYLTEIERLVTTVMVALWSFPPSIFWWHLTIFSTTFL